MKCFLRIILFILLIILSALFFWWLFLPLALIYVVKVNNPFEILLAGAIFDSVYFYSSDPWLAHNFLIFSVVVLIAIMVLGSNINWKKWA